MANMKETIEANVRASRETVPVDPHRSADAAAPMALIELSDGSPQPITRDDPRV